MRKFIGLICIFATWASVISDEQPQQQPQDLQLAVSGFVPVAKVRRSFRSMNPTYGSGFSLPTNPNQVLFDYPIQHRPRAPRWPYNFGNYQLPMYTSPTPSVIKSYRRLRSNIPSFDSISGDEQQPTSDQLGRLRFLGWLFGRPSISPYPDYSMLEEAAGVSPYGLGSRYPYSRPHSPVVVEECVEMLDPYSHHVIEECQDVPSYY